MVFTSSINLCKRTQRKHIYNLIMNGCGKLIFSIQLRYINSLEYGNLDKVKYADVTHTSVQICLYEQDLQKINLMNSQRKATTPVVF